MATDARWDMAFRRNNVRTFTIRLKGVDLTGKTMRQQVRLAPDTPGAPVIALETVTSATAEGLRLAGVEVVDGVPVSTIVGRYNLTTMRDKLPYGGEVGDDYPMVHEIEIDGKTRFYGRWTARGTVMDSDNAPTQREPFAGQSARASAETVQLTAEIADDEVFEIVLDGAAEVGALIDRASTAAELARQYANADTDTDIPGGAPGSRGAAFYANKLQASYIGRFLSDKPNAQLMPSSDVRLASNWTLAASSGTGAVQSGAVVDLEDQLFPVPGLFGYAFTLQDAAKQQRVEIVSPQFAPIDLSNAGFVVGDTITFAIFARNFSVNPLDASKYLQFGFNMGINRAAIPMTSKVEMGNGWICYFVQKVLTAADLVDSATTGSINGFMLRTQASATDTFSGVLAAPLIFKGTSLGFLRFLQADTVAALNTQRSQIIEDQLKGPAVAFVGDSRTIQGLVGPTLKYYTNRAYVHWLRMLSRQNFDTTAALNFGQSGWRTDQILAALPGYLATMKAARVEVCCLLAGTNDINATNPATGAKYTAADTLANLQAMVDRIKAAGIRVVIQNETPRGDLSGALKAQHVAVRNGINAMHAPLSGVAVADSWSALADSADPTVAASWATVDGVHMTVRGTFVQGRAVVPALAMFLPRAREVLPRDNTQMIARNGNLLPNGLMAGSGAIADGWAYINSAGGTAAATSSLYTDAAGNSWQRAVLSGTPSGSDASPLFHRWTANIDIYKGQFQAGDVLDATLEVMVETPVGLRSLDFMIVGPGNYDGAADIAGSTAEYQLGPDTYFGVLRALPVPLSGEPANLQMRIRAVVANGVLSAGTLYWRAAAIRRLNR